jgi:hypothetical protein
VSVNALFEPLMQHYGRPLTREERTLALLRQSRVLGAVSSLLFELYNPERLDLTPEQEREQFPLWRRAAGTVACWVQDVDTALAYRRVARRRR